MTKAVLVIIIYLKEHLFDKELSMLSEQKKREILIKNIIDKMKKLENIRKQKANPAPLSK